MKAIHTLTEDFQCDLSEQDLADVQDIITIGKLAWDLRNKKLYEFSDSPVFRLYNTYSPNSNTNINPNLVSAVNWFPLAPPFYRCVASTSNKYLLELFEKLIHKSIQSYNKPFSAIVCILWDHAVRKHRHVVDPSKGIVTNTYYYTLTKNPVNAAFLIEDETYPLYNQGMLEFNPTSSHGIDDRDNNLRFYVIIDSI